MVGAAVLLTREFDNIGKSSLLRYFVDAEIRQLAGVLEAQDVVYRSSPVDGASKSLNSIKVITPNSDLAYEKALKYFIDLGYQKKSLNQLYRNDAEITIENVEGVLFLLRSNPGSSALM